MINLRKAAMLGMGSGAVMLSNIIPQPKTQKGEKRLNKIATAAGLGAVTALGVAGKDLFKTTKAASFEKVGKYVEKSAEYAKKAVNSETVQKATSKISSIVEKAKSTKVGNAFVEGISKLINKAKATKVGQAVADNTAKTLNIVKSNNIVKKVTSKIGEYIQKFVKAPTATKGKYALVGAGVALLTYGAYKLVTNFFKKEGAIDQKYADLREQYQHMVQFHPVTNAQTGEPISFEEYCVMAQTKV